jgi:DNA-binding transcriptional LysR family regulator
MLHDCGAGWHGREILGWAMDWTELPFFLAAARTGSLRAASAIVGGSHATIDRHLRALEASYGVRLFERSTTGLILTSAGQQLLPLAEEAETAVIKARRRVQGLDREAAGTVKVTVPPSLAYNALPPIFARFCARHPEIELDIVVTDQIQDLARLEVDVSVRVAHEVTDDVVGRRLLRYASGVYASQGYLDRHWAQRGHGGEGLHWIGWGDTVAQSDTGPVPKSSPVHDNGWPPGIGSVPDWVRNSPFPRASLRHNARDGYMITHMVKEGLGMSFLPCYLSDYEAGLVRVPDTEAWLDRSIWLLLHADLRKTTRVRLLVDHMVDELKAMRAAFLRPLR